MSLIEQFYMWLKGIWPGWEWAAYLIPVLVGILVLIAFIFIMVIVFIYIERRLLARFQIRIGPNRFGPEGIFQPIATAVKILLKEDIVPTNVDKVVHFLAPLIVFIPIMLIFAVVPIHDGAILTDLNVGIVYVVAISSISTVGIFMAGWGSNNKYALIAAMRTIAQMISYEFPIILSIIGVVLMTGSLSMTQIVENQTIPYFLMQPLGFVIFFIGALAEMNRCPFDLLEADSEIVAGYHTEYSGMKFAMFYLGEYGHAAVHTAVISTLFLGGWKGPLLPPIIWLLIKMIIIFFVIVWIRSTIPRLRVDQLMGFAWKGLLPMAIINLFIVAIEKLLLPGNLLWVMIIINFAMAGILILLWSRLFRLEAAELKFERYGIGIAKGMVLTFKHLFRHPLTVQYPEEKLVVSRRIRGNELVWFVDRCTGCATCAKCCPQGNIEIVTHKDGGNQYIVDKFEIDTGRCIFCGLCVESCPYEALAMGMSYERAQYRRNDMILNKESLAPSENRVASGYFRPKIEALLPKQSLLIYWDKKKEEGGQKLNLLPMSKKRGSGV